MELLLQSQTDENHHPKWVKGGFIGSCVLTSALVAGVHEYDDFSSEASTREAFGNQYGKCLDNSSLSPEYTPNITSTFVDGGERIVVSDAAVDPMKLEGQPQEVKTLVFSVSREGNDIDLYPFDDATSEYLKSFNCSLDKQA